MPSYCLKIPFSEILRCILGEYCGFHLIQICSLKQACSWGCFMRCMVGVGQPVVIPEVA